MNGNMGASIALSFLVVGIVAVGLYEPETHPPRPSGAEPIEVVATPESGPSDPLPPLTPTVPRTDASAQPASPPPSPQPDLVSSSTAPRSDDDGSARDPGQQRILATSPEPLPDGPAARPISRLPIEGTLRPRAPFTIAADGETLADVALRVYGSPTATRDLWLANRDHLERVDAPLPAGTLLRTP